MASSIRFLDHQFCVIMLCNKISEWWHATDNLIAQYAHWAYTPLVGWTASEFHSGVSPVTMWSPAKSFRKDSVESSNLKRCQFKRRSSASKILIQNEWTWSYQVSLISVICDNVAVMRLKARQNNCTDKWVCEFKLSAKKFLVFRWQRLEAACVLSSSFVMKPPLTRLVRLRT